MNTVMRIVIYGNAGSGKTTMARELAARHKLPILSLDAIAFVDGPVRRPLEESIAELNAFIAANPDWIMEGCYGGLVEAALPACTELRFLNPGVEVCVTRCRERAWEPDKFASPHEQDKVLEFLIQWVREYESRTDEFGLRRHRAIFDGFTGNKCEYSAASC